MYFTEKANTSNLRLAIKLQLYRRIHFHIYKSFKKPQAIVVSDLLDVSPFC